MILSDHTAVIKTIKDKLINKYDDTISTLKQCSYDSENKVFLCESNKMVYDFDMIKKQYCKSMKYEEMASMDSLIEIDKRNLIYLVEFKNKENLPYKDIRAKIHDSLFIMENDFEVPREMFSVIELIVVYNPKKNKRKALEGIRNHFKERAGGEHDEIEHFKMFKDRFNIQSYKFSNEDFLKYLESSS